MLPYPVRPPQSPAEVSSISSSLDPGAILSPDDLDLSRFPHLFPPITLSPFPASIRASWSWVGWVCTKRRVDRGRDTALSPCAVTMLFPGDLLRFQSRFMSRTPSHYEMGIIDSIVQVGKLRPREANDLPNVMALMNGIAGLQMPTPGLH